jgi:hypothetical protein
MCGQDRTPSAPLGEDKTMRDQIQTVIPFPLKMPWIAEDNGEPLEAELKRELRTDGLLQGKQVKAIARRIDCDDVLFTVEDSDYPLAVVHLTWAGKTDQNKGWPETALYSGWEAWRTECMLPDAEEYGE